MYHPEEYEPDEPRWRFSHADKEKWSVHDGICPDMVHTLASFELMTWQDIFSAPKGGKHTKGSKSHHVSIADFSHEAQKRADYLKLGAEDFVSLRLSAKERLIGFKVNNVFHIIWHDPNHEVIPSKKRNT
jgi:hypothetical protein